ncbi:MAG: gamma-glutamylcyclotransferase [Gammaproteobacteria bacterium]|nr:MAG: gamma-glutamylcyclotransferase [Gammaproteobacteria bacterium]
MTKNTSHIVFICGSALRGQPDHSNLQGAEFLGEARTIDGYRIHAIKDGWHPGIYEVTANGVSIPGELYRLSKDSFDYLVSTEPPDMYPADISLDDGRTATAMFYPEQLIRENGWPDISDHGGWISFKNRHSEV